MNTEHQFKRRNYFINKEFQGRYIFHYFLLTVIGSLLFIGVFSFFSSNTLSIVYDNYHLQLGLTPDILLHKILSTQWLLIVFGGGAVVIITLFLTHRVAGPFYRFQKAVDDMIEGNISGKIILRKKDEGKDLAKKINTLNDTLKNKLSLMDNFNSEIAFSCQQLNKAMVDKGIEIETLALHLNRISDNRKNIQTIIDYYTLFREEPEG